MPAKKNQKKNNGGIRKGTADYRKIRKSLQEEFGDGNYEAYDSDVADRLYRQSAQYQVSYGIKNFKDSIKRLVERLQKQEEKFSDEEEDEDEDEDATNQESASAPPTATAPTDPPSPPRMSSPVPSADQLRSSGLARELVDNDEISVHLPHHIWDWKDSDENDHVTLILLLPVDACHNERDLYVYCGVESGGTQVKVELRWPESFLCELVPRYAHSVVAGEAVLTGNDVRVVAFKESVKSLRVKDSKSPVWSVFRCDTPIAVEEQLTDENVPAPISIVEVPCKGLFTIPVLFVEMMGVRSNYKQSAELEEMFQDFSALGF